VPETSARRSGLRRPRRATKKEASRCPAGTATPRVQEKQGGWCVVGVAGTDYGEASGVHAGGTRGHRGGCGRSSGRRRIESLHARSVSRHASSATLGPGGIPESGAAAVSCALCAAQRHSRASMWHTASGGSTASLHLCSATWHAWCPASSVAAASHVSRSAWHSSWTRFLSARTGSSQARNALLQAARRSASQLAATRHSRFARSHSK
jgi:hypothetical protein